VIYVIPCVFLRQMGFSNVQFVHDLLCSSQWHLYAVANWAVILERREKQKWWWLIDTEKLRSYFDFRKCTGSTRVRVIAYGDFFPTFRPLYSTPVSFSSLIQRLVPAYSVFKGPSPESCSQSITRVTCWLYELKTLLSWVYCICSNLKIISSIIF